MTPKTPAFPVLLGITLFGLISPASARSDCSQGARRLIPRAAKVDLSHLGAHTHRNFIHFDAGPDDVGQYPGLHLVAHCRLGTDHAALPPGFGALTQDAGPVPTLGPIERWAIAPDRRNGRDGVRATVPTRFANWVAGQPAALRRRYQSVRSYSLEIDWQK